MAIDVSRSASHARRLKSLARTMFSSSMMIFALFIVGVTNAVPFSGCVTVSNPTRRAVVHGRVKSLVERRSRAISRRSEIAWDA